MNGGHDRAFASLEAAHAYAGELLGENDSLDLHITDETGQRHLTAEQREFVDEATDPTKVAGEIIFQQGNRQRLSRNRRERQNEMSKEMAAM